MPLQTIAIGLVIAAGLVAAASGLYVARPRISPASATGSLLLFASAEWPIAHAIELAATHLKAKILWESMQLVGMLCIIPAAWFVITVSDNGRGLPTELDFNHAETVSPQKSMAS